jgi:hypothetical protein
MIWKPKIYRISPNESIYHGGLCHPAPGYSNGLVMVGSLGGGTVRLEEEFMVS